MTDVSQKQCSICATNTGVLTCNGCQQTFCVKHSLEHRQQLANQIDNIIREHDSLRPEFERTPKNQTLLDRIDTWEKESIAKIQAAARSARQDLQQMIEKAKEPISTVYRNMSMKLRSSREADDYSEHELKRWMRQLQQLKSDLTGPVPIRLVEQEWSVIKLIQVKNMSYAENHAVSSTHERFAPVTESITLDGDGLVAKHTSNDGTYEYVLGEQCYYEGRHTIRLRIEGSGIPYDIFFGCISSDGTRSRVSINSSSCAGWAGFNQVFRHGVHNGNTTLHGYHSDQISVGDVLSLTFDCDKRQIEFFHEDTNQRHILSVNVQQAPLPWQLLLMLTNRDDCVRILRPSIAPATSQPPTINPVGKVPIVAAPKSKTPIARPKGKAPTTVSKARKTKF